MSNRSQLLTIANRLDECPPVPTSVLWVDDEIGLDDPGLRLLRQRYSRVDHADSAAAAFARLAAITYDVIILELRLPDMDGLTLLEILQREHRSAAVIVLASVPRSDETESARRLGALMIRDKPVAPALLAESVDVALANGSGLPFMLRCEPAADVPCGERQIIVRLTQVLARVAAQTPVSRPERSTRRETSEHALVVALSDAIGSRAVAIPCFLACAAAFRIVVDQRSDAALSIRAERARATLADMSRRLRLPKRGKVREAVACLEDRLRKGVRPKQYQIAAEIGSDAVHLGRIFKADTGVAFSDWKTAYAIRTAVRLLTETDNLVSQIGYQLGFEHPSQFIRDFELVIGLTPRAYRRRCSESPPLDRPVMDGGRNGD